MEKTYITQNERGNLKMANTIFFPELVAAGVEANLGNAIKLYPLLKVENFENKVGGDKLRVFKSSYIGDASVVAPGAMIPITDFAESTELVDVVKYAKAVKFTQEEILSGVNVQERAEQQLTKSVAAGIENALFAELKAITGAMLYAGAETALTTAVVSNALVKMGEDIDSEMYLFVNPAELGNLRKDPNFVEKLDGRLNAIGSIYGANVVVSNRVGAKEAFLIRPDALAVALKKEITVESQKEVANQTFLVAGTAHAAVYVADESGAVKITLA